MVGRVHFHLAENKRDADRPFAFLATYTTGLSQGGKPQHRPLGDAVREASSAADRRRLLGLLQPVQRASERSALVKAMADTGRVFQPQAWTPGQATVFSARCRCSKGAACRGSRLVAQRPRAAAARQRVRGRGARGRDSARSSLRSSPHARGAELTPAELRRSESKAAGSPCSRAGGSRWTARNSGGARTLAGGEAGAGDGVSFLEGMRLLAGVKLGAAEEARPRRPGVGRGPGGRLAGRDAGGPAGGRGGVATRAQRCSRAAAVSGEGVKWLCAVPAGPRGVPGRRHGAREDNPGPRPPAHVEATSRPCPALASSWSPRRCWRTGRRRRAVRAPAARAVSIRRRCPGARCEAVDAEAISRMDVVVMTYARCARIPGWRRCALRLVVLDEAQAIKNPGARQTRALKELPAGRPHRAQRHAGREPRSAISGRSTISSTPGCSERAGVHPLREGLQAARRRFHAVAQLVARISCGGSRPTARSSPICPDKTELKALCALGKRQAALYEESVRGTRPRNRHARRRHPAARAWCWRSSCASSRSATTRASGWAMARLRPRRAENSRAWPSCAEIVSSRQEKALVFTQFREMTEPLAALAGEVFGRPGLVLARRRRR